MGDLAAAVSSVFPLIAPEVFLIAGGCAFFLAAAFTPMPRPGADAESERAEQWSAFSLAVLAAAGAIWLMQHNVRSTGLAANLLRFDMLAWYTKGLSLGGAAMLVLLGWRHAPGRLGGEYQGCLLIAVAGLNFIGMSNDLVALFLALEMVSIPTYVLLYLAKHDAPGQEASLKYFLLSVFSSAVGLYGMSLLYGVSGTTNLEVLRTVLLGREAAGMTTILLAALVFVVAGLSFRITAVPFHFYAPDVFAGTSLPMAAYLSFVPKVAGFAALFRLVSGTLLAAPQSLPDGAGPPVQDMALMLGVLACLTMFVGNLLALQQTDLRRLLAYSGVAHGGYMLAALSVGQPIKLAVPAAQAVLFYLTAYGAMTLGAFAVLAAASSPEKPLRTIDDLRGLFRRRPFLAVMLTVFLFSMIGLPPTAGMMAKLQILLAIWSKQSFVFIVLAAIVAVNAALGAVYYLKTAMALYADPRGERFATRGDFQAQLVAVVCLAITLGLFFAPNLVLSALEMLY